MSVYFGGEGDASVPGGADTPMYGDFCGRSSAGIFGHADELDV